MKIPFVHILIAVGVVVLAISTYGMYQKSLDAENVRLKEIAERQFEDIDLPPGSTLIYQEAEASRICKTAAITKLFAIDNLPEDICEFVYLPLQAGGWQSYAGCRTNTNPYKRTPIDGDKPSYVSAGLDAASPTRDLGVSVRAMPSNAWGQLFILSPFGTQEAIPLARKSGTSFYTVKIHYTEDHALFERHCPESHPRCDCIPSTLFEWRFSDGRMRSRSN